MAELTDPKEIKKKLRLIDLRIRRLEEKYGMSYKEFYNRFEGDISPLLKKFDFDVIMNDFEELLTLLCEKEKLLKELGKDVNLLAELDEDWISLFHTIWEKIKRIFKLA